MLTKHSKYNAKKEKTESVEQKVSYIVVFSITRTLYTHRAFNPTRVISEFVSIIKVDLYQGS